MKTAYEKMKANFALVQERQRLKKEHDEYWRIRMAEHEMFERIKKVNRQFVEQKHVFPEPHTSRWQTCFKLFKNPLK